MYGPFHKIELCHDSDGKPYVQYDSLGCGCCGDSSKITDPQEIESLIYELNDIIAELADIHEILSKLDTNKKRRL